MAARHQFDRPLADWRSKRQRQRRVAAIVKSTPGAIGYVDYSTAKGAGLTFASVKNKDGNYVAPSPGSAALAASQVTLEARRNVQRDLGGGSGSYPITYQSWDLVYTRQPNANDANMLRAYLGYLLGAGQELLPQLGYAPLPSSIDQQAQAQLNQDHRLTCIHRQTALDRC